MNYKKLFLNLLTVAAPIAAGVISGGVFTLPVLTTALGTLAARFLPSLAEDVATAKSALTARKDARGQAIDDEDPE